MLTRKNYFRWLLCCFIVESTSCALTPTFFEPYNFQHEIQSKSLTPKIDHLIILLDASISMTDTYLGREKFQTAIMALHQLNESLTEIKVPTGFRIMGTGACHFCKHSQKLFDISSYDPSRLTIDQLQKIHPGGETPMHEALFAVKNDFGNCEGNLCLIIISDWNNNNQLMNDAIDNLCTTYSERITIINIVVGNPIQKEMLSVKSKIPDGCVQWINVETLLSFADLKNIVQTIFLAPVYDSDADGINDLDDKCPKTPKDALIDQYGCSKDTDNDGIMDGLDLCPKTPERASVDLNGCWTLPVLFYQSNQFYMSREQEQRLLPMINILKKQKICLEIQGYADNSGSHKKNFDISKRRAQSVMAFFLSKGIRRYQLQIKAFGSNPSIDNSLQRRVEFLVVPCRKNNR